VKWIIRIGIITVGIPSLAIGLLVLARFRPSHGHVHAEIEIDRPPAEVFRWIVQQDLLRRWVGGLSDVSQISPATDGSEIGKRYHLTAVDKEESTRTEMEMTVTDYVPDQIFGVRIRSLGNPSEGFTENAEYRLTAIPGGTRLTLEIQTEYFGKLPRVLEPLITPAARKKAQRDFTRLKTLVETEIPAAGS
jgi:uncharacterized protein YndB with AHSA1/START domain